MCQLWWSATRTADLRAYANTCRHRSVIAGNGGGGELHSNALPVSLLDIRPGRTPSRRRRACNGLRDFERAAHGLYEFAATERYGFAFVSLGGIAPTPIDQWLGDFGDVHAPLAIWPIACYHSVAVSSRCACNWKGFAEVFNEYYHLPYVHPGSIDDTYNEPDEPEDVVGAWATHFEHDRRHRWPARG